MDEKTFRRIAGTSHSVWTVRRNKSTLRFNTDSVWKITSPGYDAAPLKTDYDTNRQIHAAMTRLEEHDLRPDIHVPSNALYAPHDQIFDSKAQSKSKPDTFQMQRIHPMPPSCQSEYLNIVSAHLSDADKQRLMDAEGAEDCLIRPYLGRDSLEHKPRVSRYFSSLSWGILPGDEVRKLGFPPARLAEIMGRTLAVLHWEVGTDANDVELSLGAAPVDASVTDNNRKQRLREDKTPVLWLFDFDRCSRMPSNTKTGWSHKDVELCVKAFYETEPYYPRPDQALWQEFKKAYLKHSHDILRLEDVRMYKRAPTGFPKDFIEAVEDGQARYERR